MGLINLPSLLQRITVDSSDMERAQAASDRMGESIQQQSERSDRSLNRLQRTQQDFRQSTEDMSRTVREATESFDEITRRQQQNTETQQRNRRETDQTASAFDRLAERVRGAGKSVGDIGFDPGILKIPALIAAAGSAGTALAAVGAAGAAVAAQFGPMLGVYGAYVPLAIAVKTSTALITSAFEQLDKSDPSGVIKRIKSLNDAAGKEAAKGIADGLKTMGPLIDVVAVKWLNFGTKMGQALGSQIKQLTSSPKFISDIGVVLDNNTKIATTFAGALAPIVNIIKNITLAAAPMAQGFVEDFVSAAQAVSKASDNTKGMTAFFERADTTARRFVGSMVDIGGAIKNVFSIGAKSIGIDFVGGLESGAKKLRDMTESAEGVKAIQGYFRDAGPVIKELGLLVRDLVVEFFKLGNNQDLVGFIRIIRTETLPAVSDMANNLTGEALPAIANLITAFAEFGATLSFNPLIETIDAFALLATAAANVVQTVPGLGEFIATLLLVKTATKGLSIASNALGITSLVTSLRGVGAAGTAGATGIAGFVQGLRGASREGSSFANRVGTAIRSGFASTVQAAGTMASGVRTAVANAGTYMRSLATSAATAGRSMMTSLAAGARAAGASMSALATNARVAATAMLTNVRAAVASAVASARTLAVQAAQTARALAAMAVANVRAALSSMGTVLAGLASGFKTAALAVKAFTVSLLTNPIFLIITAIIALGAALVLLYKKNETFRDFVNAAWAGIKAAISAVVGWIVNTAWPWLQQAWEGIKVAAQALWNVMKTAWEGIKAVITTVIGFIKTYISTYVAVWVTVFRTALEGIKAVVTTAWNGIKLVVTTQMNLIKTAVDIFWNGVKIVFTTAFNIIKTVVTTGWNLIKTVFTTALNVVKAVLTGNFGAIPGIVKGGMDKAWSLVKAAWTSIKSATMTGIGEMVLLMRSIGSKVVSAVGNLGKLLLGAGRQIVQGLIDGINAKLGALRQKASEMASAVKSFLPGSPVKEGPLTILNRGYAGGQIVKMIQDGITKAGNLKLPGFDPFTPQVPSQLGNLGASSFPRPPVIGGQSSGPGSVNNSRVYNVTIYETTGPSTNNSITDRLRLLDVTL
jgi:hypothetical protein